MTPGMSLAVFLAASKSSDVPNIPSGKEILAMLDVRSIRRIVISWVFSCIYPSSASLG
jgi:hypothetical protein